MALKRAIQSDLLFRIGLFPLVVLLSCFLLVPTRSAADDERSVRGITYLPSSGETPETAARISEYQKLLDDKNYERTTTIRVNSINGGEGVEREINETSKKLSDSKYLVERSIRRPDPSGRLITDELTKEEHVLNGNTHEIERTQYRSDVNGKMAPQSVEKETILEASPRETITTRTLYRPDPEGKFTLFETEEGSKRKISDSVSTLESTRKRKEANGRMATIESLKETTTQLGNGSFKKESQVRRADDSGRLQLTDKVTETQSEEGDGVRRYQRLLESKQLNRMLLNVNSSGLILAERVTGEERRLTDGSLESTSQIETIDPVNESKGLRVSEIITEVTKPLPNGKVSVERVVKTRDPNGNFIVSEKMAQTMEPSR